jgi:isoleucyl-tRNA synthetase
MATSAPELPSTAFADFPVEEERIIQFWRACDAFQKSYELSVQEGRKPYVFYDGPPFATVCFFMYSH